MFIDQLLRPLRTAGVAVALSACALTAFTGTAAAGPAAAPAVAAGASGTIVYAKDHNVYIARGDGSGARKITTNGTKDAPYHSPSESDAGIIAAARGTLIIRMTQAWRQPELHLRRHQHQHPPHPRGHQLHQQPVQPGHRRNHRLHRHQIRP